MPFNCAAGARRRGPRSAPLWAAILLSVAASSASAADPGASDGSSGAAAQEAARRAIPWNKLSHQDRRIAQFMVKNESVFRRMPTRVVECEPEVFTFLAQRPEIVSSIWNVMGVSQLQVERTSSNTFKATDNAGTNGALRVMHADWDKQGRNRVLLYAEGLYEAKPLPRPIKARSLLVLQSVAHESPAGEPLVTARLDAFMHFERATAELVAKTLSPLINRTADHNFTETMKFVGNFAKTTRQNPSGVARLADRLEGIDDEVRADLITLCRDTAARGRTAKLDAASTKTR